MLMVDNCRDAGSSAVSRNGLTLVWRGTADWHWAAQWALGYREAADANIAALAAAGWITAQEAHAAPRLAANSLVRAITDALPELRRELGTGGACAVLRYMLNDNHMPIVPPRVSARR
jgi:hypothetical protein